MDPPIEPVAFSLFVFASFVFAGVEGALAGFGLHRIAEMSADPNCGAGRGRLFELWQGSRSFILTRLRVARTLCLAGAFFLSAPWVLAATPASSLAPEIAVSLAILFLWILGISLLLLCDLLPAAWARQCPEHFDWALLIGFQGLRFVGLLVAPALRLTRVWRRLLGGGEDPPVVTEEDIEDMIRRGRHHGSLDEEQEELLSSVFDFREIVVREVMVPRTSVEAFDVVHSLEDVFAVVERSGFSRYPVYEDSMDRVKGVFYVKDLLGHLQGPQKQPFMLRDNLREPYFVPESKKIHDLMREFQTHKVHMAVVVDEFGGTAGLVTQEDIIEEIFGEIYDEHDATEEPSIEQTGSGSFLTDARISVRDFEEALGVTCPEQKDYDTVGGFVVALAGRVPKAGDAVDWEDLRFTILQADDTKVVRLEINRVEPDVVSTELESVG